MISWQFPIYCIFIYFIISLQIPPLKILLFTFQIHISTSKIHLIQIIDNWIKITALDRTNTILYKKGKKYDKYSSACIISLFLSLSLRQCIFIYFVNSVRLVTRRRARRRAWKWRPLVRVRPCGGGGVRPFVAESEKK